MAILKDTDTFIVAEAEGGSPDLGTNFKISYADLIAKLQADGLGGGSMFNYVGMSKNWTDPTMGNRRMHGVVTPTPASPGIAAYVCTISGGNEATWPGPGGSATTVGWTMPRPTTSTSFIGVDWYIGNASSSPLNAMPICYQHIA